MSPADPFAVKRNVARTLNSQQMYEYILHCLKTTYKYFGLPLNAPAGGLKAKARRGPVGGVTASLGQLGVQSPGAGQSKAAESGPEDSDCIIEEEEEVEEFSDSDEEREKEKADLGKSSLSEDDDEEDDAEHNRQHLDSLTTEDEDIFLVDEISGEELLSDEEGPDLDTPGSMDDEEEGIELVSESLASTHLEDTIEEKSPEAKTQQLKRRSFAFTRQAFTRGKVSVAFDFVSTCWENKWLMSNLGKQFTVLGWRTTVS